MNKEQQQLTQKNIKQITGLPIKRFYSVSQNCKICLETLLTNESNNENSDIFRTTCGDTFHKGCIAELLKNQISVKNQSLRCPSKGCNEKLSASLLPKLGFQKKEINRYFCYQLEELMISNPTALSCCPTPGCPNIYKLNKDNIPTLNCELCSKNYCLQCKSEAHPSFTCIEYQNSKNQQNNENEFKKLVQNLNCKQCQKCGAWILKEKGCNHMICKCKYEFCYKCGRSYRHKDCKCPLFDRDQLPQP